jgi:hypothetical protein
MTKTPDGKTLVVLRRLGKDVIALFPDLDAGRGHCLSYMRIGQHGQASRNLPRDTKPAHMGEPDVAALVRELTNLGYDLQIVARMPRRIRKGT